MAVIVKCISDFKVVPMCIPGSREQAEEVLWGMIESSDSLRGMDFNQFSFNSVDGLMLDPGGMIMQDDPTIKIELLGGTFFILRQHLISIEGLFHPDRDLQERLPGWYRVTLRGGNHYIPTSLRVSLYEALKRERVESQSAIKARIAELRATHEKLKSDLDPLAGVEFVSSKLRHLEVQIADLEREERWSFH